VHAHLQAMVMTVMVTVTIVMKQNGYPKFVITLFHPPLDVSVIAVLYKLT
jgi:hypothetical protein